MKVTREMLGKAHDILLKNGLMLSGKMIEEIYLAMDALANHAETSSSLFQMQEAAKDLVRQLEQSRTTCKTCEALARTVMMDQIGRA